MQSVHHRHYHYHYHTAQYIILLLLICTGIASLARLTGEPLKQTQILILIGLTYALWGVFHHIYDHDLNWKIVVEYSSVAVIGITMLWTLLFYI